MRRGTTPTLVFKISDNANLEGIAYLRIDFAINDEEFLTKEYPADTSIAIDTENKKVSVSLTQEETLKFPPKMVNAQIRWKKVIDDKTYSYATTVPRIPVRDVLYDGVI